MIKCPVFSAVLDAAGKNLEVTESTTNEAGGYCDITLNLTDGFDYADEVTITYGIVPVNDAPEILNWDPSNGVAIYDGNGEINSESEFEMIDDYNNYNRETESQSNKEDDLLQIPAFLRRQAN